MVYDSHRRRPTQSNPKAQEFKSYWQQDCAIDTNTLVALPSAPGAAPLLKTPAEDLAEYRNQLMGLTAPAGLLGAPQISLPVLQDENAPWGLSLLAPVGRDQALLAMAESLLPNLHNLKGS